MSKTSTKPARKKANAVSGMHYLDGVDPHDIERMRSTVFHIVRQNMPRVREVLEGKRQWSAQQLKLFSTLFGKVMPDLKEYRHLTDDTDIESLSQEQLTQIIAAAQAAGSIPHLPTPPSAPQPPTLPIIDANDDEALALNQAFSQ